MPSHPSDLPRLHSGSAVGLPPPSRSPRQRRFSFSSRLKRCGDAPRGRSGRRAGCFQVPGPGLASAGLRPERLQEHLPSCADSRIPEQGWGGPGPRALRPPLGTSVPAPPCHPGAAPSPTPRVRLSPPHPPCCSQGWAPKPHLLPTRPLNLRPFPPTRPRTEARRILFSHCFHCVIPEFKNPLGSLLEQEDTPTTTKGHPVPGDTPSISHLLSPILAHLLSSTILGPSLLPKSPPPPSGPGNSSPLTCACAGTDRSTHKENEIRRCR